MGPETAESTAGFQSGWTRELKAEAEIQAWLM